MSTDDIDLDSFSLDVKIAIDVLRPFIRWYGIEGTLRLVEYAKRLEFPPSPIPDNYPIDQLELMVRTNNCLRNHGLMTVGAVREKLREDPLWLMKYVKHFGRRSDNDIKEAIGWRR